MQELKNDYYYKVRFVFKAAVLYALSKEACSKFCVIDMRTEELLWVSKLSTVFLYSM